MAANTAVDPAPKVLALVMAGGNGTRLHPLTAEHAKPALLLTPDYRIIDFVLSNLVNSGIASIYVLAQYKPQSLLEHIRTIWAPILCERGGFIRVVLPETDVVHRPFLGTADAVYKNLHLCAQHAPDLVAVFAADHIYRMDVTQMIDTHVQSRADISIAAIPVAVERASQFGVVSAQADGRVREFQEKPEHPASIPGQPDHAYASMGNYLFNPGALAVLLEQAADRGETDFGWHVLPRAIKTHRVFAYDFASNKVPGMKSYEEPNYWRDVGTIEAFSAAQRDALSLKPKFDLTNQYWPIGGPLYSGMAEPTSAAN